MADRQKLLCALGCVLALVLGICHGWEMTQKAAVFAFAEEENLFAMPVENEFTIEVIGMQTPKPPKRVLIYHTHTYEAFAKGNAPYKETEKWRTADNAYNVVRVGEELAALLRSLGVEAVHDATAFEPPDLGGAYARSLKMLESRKAAGERYDLYIDLHRDAATSAGANCVTVGGVDTARLMLLIGRGESYTGQGYDQKPDWEANRKIAQSLTDEINRQADGLCRDVCEKPGRFNQHVASACLLVEAGNNLNTLDEVLAAMPYLADAVAEWLQP